MVELFNQIQIGTVYLTSTAAAGGTKYIATVQGLDVFGIAAAVQDIRALSGTVYQQSQTIVDAPVTINVPLMEATMYDAIRDVFTAYLATPSAFTFAVTGQPENFSGTAKPAFDPKPLEFDGGRIGDKITNVVIRLYVTD